MKKKRTRAILIIIIAAIAALALVYQFYFKAVKMNDSFVNGNTGGNNYNNGLFCEYSGTVYFSNPDDGYCLYSMDAGGGNLAKLSTDAVSSINTDGHYLYFIRENSNAVYDFSFLQYNNNVLCRTDMDGKHLEVLDGDPCMYATLIGNYLYYLHYDTETATTACRIKIDGQEKERISSETIYTCGADERFLYYNGIDSDHNIYRMDTSTLSSELIAAGNYWMPQVSGDAVYFLDCEDGYSLKKLSSGAMDEPVTLAGDFVETYNVYGSVIFYQVHQDDIEESALYRVNTDGTGATKIASGEFKNINVTSTYTYFHDYNDNGPTYCVPTYGDTALSVFSPGAVTEETK